MSCITKILEHKGFINDRILVEGGGIYKGYEYLITFVRMGHRCGYVALKGDENFKCAEDEYYQDFDVHGGITFCSSEHSLKSFFDTKCNDIWLGFDCGHFLDGKDFTTWEKFVPLSESTANLIKFYRDNCSDLGHAKNFSYVEQECKSLINQILEKKMIESCNCDPDRLFEKELDEEPLEEDEEC